MFGLALSAWKPPAACQEEPAVRTERSIRAMLVESKTTNVCGFVPSPPPFLPRGDCMAAGRRNGKFAYQTRGYVARHGSLTRGRLREAWQLADL